MDVSIQSLSSTNLTNNSTLIVSRDETLVKQLRGILEEDHRHRVEVVPTYDAAEEFVRRQPPETVFIDFRKAHSADSPESLLQRLGKRGKRGKSRIPVIAVADSGYVCDWAVVADLLVRGHVQLPLDREQLFRLLDSDLASNIFHATHGSIAPRVVRAKTVSLKTYTPEMFGLMDDLVTMAKHDVTVLLVGETGTGKTTLARMIHELSPRKKSGFLTIGCGALPPELIESELFGHVKGAFTSADRTKIGKFEAAQDGTLLLDEIDVLDPGQQAKLLRVIETGEFEPVGSNDTRCSKARLVVASNVDLSKLMERNEFRADLYYRLNVLELRIPPLRERRQDIVPLTLGFIDEFCKAHDVSIHRVHPDFLACLKAYSWPGNIRELKNHIRRAVLFCQTGTLTPDSLSPQFRQAAIEPAPATSIAAETDSKKTFVEKVAVNEREILEKALLEHNNNRTATARSLGLSRVGLYKKLKKLGLVTPRK